MNSITHELEILRYILQNTRRLSLPSSEKKPKSIQIGIIFSLTHFFFCPFFAYYLHFCIILPF